MRIYTHLVIDIRTSQVLEERSYEYDGPVAQCKGGSGKVKETEEEKELARIAGERWQRYENVFQPLEGTLIKRMNMGADERAQATGLTNAAVQKQFAPAQAQVAGALDQRGVQRASAAGLSAMGDLSTARAESDALAEVDTDEAVTDLHYQGLESMIQMGRGKAVSGLGGLSSIAQNATQRAVQQAQNAFNERRGNVHAGMMALGYGLNRYVDRGAGAPAPTQTSPSDYNPALGGAAGSPWRDVEGMS